MTGSSSCSVERLPWRLLPPSCPTSQESPGHLNLTAPHCQTLPNLSKHSTMIQTTAPCQTKVQMPSLKWIFEESATTCLAKPVDTVLSTVLIVCVCVMDTWRKLQTAQAVLFVLSDVLVFEISVFCNSTKQYVVINVCSHLSKSKIVCANLTSA